MIPLRHINKLESEGGQKEVRGYVNAKKALGLEGRSPGR